MARNPTLSDLTYSETALAWATAVVRGQRMASIRGTSFSTRDLIGHLEASKTISDDMAPEVDPYVGIDSDRVTDFVTPVVNRVRAPTAAAMYAAVIYARHHSDVLRMQSDGEVLDGVLEHLPHAVPLLQAIASRVDVAVVPPTVRKAPTRQMPFVGGHQAVPPGLVTDPFVAPTRWGRRPGEALPPLERALMAAGVEYAYAGVRMRFVEPWKSSLRRSSGIGEILRVPRDVSRDELHRESVIAVDADDPFAAGVIEEYARANGMVGDVHDKKVNDEWLPDFDSRAPFSLWSRDIGFVRVVKVDSDTLEAIRHTSDLTARCAIAGLASRVEGSLKLVAGWLGTCSQASGGVPTVSLRNEGKTRDALARYVEAGELKTVGGRRVSSLRQDLQRRAAFAAAARAPSEVVTVDGGRFCVRLCDRKEFKAAQDEFRRDAPPLREPDDVPISPLATPSASEVAASTSEIAPPVSEVATPVRRPRPRIALRLEPDSPNRDSGSTVRMTAPSALGRNDDSTPADAVEQGKADLGGPTLHEVAAELTTPETPPTGSMNDSLTLD